MPLKMNQIQNIHYRENNIMKKLLLVILTIIMLLSSFSGFVVAEDNQSIISKSTEYFEDGSYIISILTIDNITSLSRNTSTATGSKTTILYSVSDEKMVTLKLTATFNYTGSSATCTNVSPTFTVHDSNYRVTKSTASKNQNVATGEFTAKHYVLGFPVQSRDVTIKITCSNTGVLS